MPQQSSWYASGPNDVWSLGVILVNLTCGRNPWKRASFGDSTYKAFARNPQFLSTILPISEELNRILGMIFELDPRKRIGLLELRSLIQGCSKFTTRPAMDGLVIPPKIQVPVAGFTSAAVSPNTSYPISPSHSSSSESSMSDSASDRSSASSWSSVSSNSSYQYASKPPSTPAITSLMAPIFQPQQPTYAPQLPPGGSFGSLYSNACRPMIQPQYNGFMSQGPLVC